MYDWPKLFKSLTSSGVYTVDRGSSLSSIEQAARLCGLTLFHIDISGVTTKEAFLQAVAKTLQFPAYFGMNWDAFEDCMTDLSWSPARGYVLVFDNLESFAHSVPKEMETARSIFDSAAVFWEKLRKPFYVLLIEKETL